jgi:MFS family permease
VRGNNLRSIYLAGFIIDYALYVAFVAVPFKAISLGATPLHLGALPAISFASYTISALSFGKLSDRVSRLALGRVGCGVFALGNILLSLCPSIAWMMLAMPLLGIGLGMFWPPVQAAIADYSRADTLERNLGIFNICWSLGKGMAFLTGAFLINWKGFSVAFYLAATLSAGTVLSLPARDWIQSAADTVRSNVPRKARSFLLMGWTGNALAFGIAATLNHHLPKLLKENGYDERRFGVILGAVFGLQTLSFLLLKLNARWKYKKRLFYVAEFVMGLSVFLLARTDALPVVLLLGAVVGMGLGLTYYASIFYSLHTDIGRGKNTGIHESVLGAGNFVVPLLGGILATTFSNLQAPYVVCLVLAIVCIGFQELIFRRDTT